MPSAVAIPVKSGSKKKGKDKKKKDESKETEDGEPELSPEDQQLKDTLDELVLTCIARGTTSTVSTNNGFFSQAEPVSEGVRTNALRMLGSEIRSATSSMTSVPKPLKFLRPHYSKLVDFYDRAVKATDRHQHWYARKLKALKEKGEAAERMETENPENEKAVDPADATPTVKSELSHSMEHWGQFDFQLSNESQKAFADVLSVLSMTMSPTALWIATKAQKEAQIDKLKRKKIREAKGGKKDEKDEKSKKKKNEKDNNKEASSKDVEESKGNTEEHDTKDGSESSMDVEKNTNGNANQNGKSPSNPKTDTAHPLLDADGLLPGGDIDATVRFLEDELKRTEPTDERRVLNYKLEGNSTEVGEWGAEYVRSLSGELGREFEDRASVEEERIIGLDGFDPEDLSALSRRGWLSKNDPDLDALVDNIVSFHLTHNSSAEAVDVLFETFALEKMTKIGSVGRTFFENEYRKEQEGGSTSTFSSNRSSLSRVAGYMEKCAGVIRGGEDEFEYKNMMRTVSKLYLLEFNLRLERATKGKEQNEKSSTTSSSSSSAGGTATAKAASGGTSESSDETITSTATTTGSGKAKAGSGTGNDINVSQDIQASQALIHALRMALAIDDMSLVQTILAQVSSSSSQGSSLSSLGKSFSRSVRRQIAYLLGQSRHFQYVFSKEHYWHRSQWDEGTSGTEDDDENEDDQEMNEEEEDEEEEMFLDELDDIVSNAYLSEHFLKVATSLDVMDAKTPEDLYKTSVTGSKDDNVNDDDDNDGDNGEDSGSSSADPPMGLGLGGSANVQSAKKNLADTIVNAFLNAGFKKDKLMNKKSSSNGDSGSSSSGGGNGNTSSSWINHNKDCGKISAAASVGMLHLWDADEGVTACDKFMYSQDKQIVTGGLLGSCLVMSGLRDSQMIVKALLEDHVFGKDNMKTMKKSTEVDSQRRMAALLGLGIAYSGTGRHNPSRKTIYEYLFRYVDPSETNMWDGIETAAYAALAIGLVFTGQVGESAAVEKGSNDVEDQFNPAEQLYSCMLQMSATDLNQPIARLFAVGLGLLYLGNGQESTDAIVECMRALGDLEGDIDLEDQEEEEEEDEGSNSNDEDKTGGSDKSDEKKDASVTTKDGASRKENTMDLESDPNLAEVQENSSSSSNAQDKNSKKKEIHPLAGFARYAEYTIRTCAAMGNGDVVISQKYLHMCAKHMKVKEEIEKEEEESAEEANAQANAQAQAAAMGMAEAMGSSGTSDEAAGGEGNSNAAAGNKKVPFKDPSYQSAVVLGLSLNTMLEPTSSAMILRTMDHLMQYCGLPVKRMVPMAIALLNVSNPDTSVTDTLSKLTHDSDENVARSAILAMGLVASGTNNARTAQMLRSLLSYYSDNADTKFIIRIAFGLVHAGKGLNTMSPVHSERLLVNKPAVAALIAFAHLSLDLPSNLLAKKHHLLVYMLAICLRPRMLLTVDSEGDEIETQVRVGKAVDTVGQVGNPMRITGFQQHASPVLISERERALLANDEFEAFSDVLEGVIVSRENMDSEWKISEKKRAKKKKKKEDLVQQARAGKQSRLTRQRRDRLAGKEKK